MSCAACLAHQARHTASKTGAQRAFDGGVVRMGCASCCALLVRSARPLRGAQEAMLAAITHRPGRPSRQQVLAALQQLDAGA